MHPFQLIYFKMQPNLPTNRGNTCSTSQRSSGLPSPCSSSSRVVSDCWATWPGHIPSAIIEICVLNDKCNSIQFQKIGLMDWFTWFNSNERLNLGNIYIYIDLWFTLFKTKLVWPFWKDSPQFPSHQVQVAKGWQWHAQQLGIPDFWHSRSATWVFHFRI